MHNSYSNLPFFLLIYFFFNFTFVEPNLYNLQIVKNSITKYDLIDQFFEKPFFLDECTFSSDIFISKEEFKYLTNLQAGTIITNNDIKNACFYLKEKNLFNEILIEVNGDESHKKLNFILKGFYTFKKLKIHGILIGKEKFSQNYIMESGEKFDEEKHNKSIQNIKNYFYKKGYCGIKIDSYFKYDTKNKAILVNIIINKGKIFSIKNIKVELTDFDNDNKEINLLQKNIEKLFIKNIVKTQYSNHALKIKKKKLAKYLKNNFYILSKITIKKDIDFQKNQINLTFKISLGKKKVFKFFGNRFFSSEYLTNFILSLDNYFFEMPAFLLSEEISNLYKSNGFEKIEINADEQQNSYLFKITEGEKSKIENILIKGSEHQNSKIIFNKFFKNILKKKFINHELLDEAIKNLNLYYLKLGFWDIKIKKKLTPISNSKYNIQILINEGKRKFIKSCIVENFDEINNSDFFNHFKKLKNAIPFDIDIINEQKEFIINFLKKKNLENINLKSDFIFNDDEVSLIWKIKSDDTKIKFGRVIIHGTNNKILFDKVLNEININPGEYFEKNKLEKTYFNLNDLKIFETVQLYPINYNDLSNNKPIILKLISDDIFEIKARLGFQQVNKNFTLFKGLGTYRIGSSFIYKNPFKLLDQIKFDADFSHVQNMIILQYKLPWLFNRPIKTLHQLYWHQYYQPLFIGSNQNIYQVSDLGYITSFMKKNEKFNFGFNLGIDAIKIYDLSEQLAKAIDFSPFLINKLVPYFFVEPNLIIDYLDDKLNPANGFLTIASFKGMFSFGENSDYFLKFLIEQSFFRKIINPLIFAMRFRFGYIITDEFKKLMPPLRFYLGGPNSVRSYEPDFSPPLGYFINKNNEKQFVPKGSKAMFNANLELRFPWFKKIGIVIFQDFGILLNNKSQCNFDRLLTATGFGFRYQTPIGPLRFDIGWRPNKKNDLSYMWFITLGHTF